MTENFAYGEINERSLSNPHPRTYHSPCMAPGQLYISMVEMLLSRT